jgi:hypothetical protein
VPVCDACRAIAAQLVIAGDLGRGEQRGLRQVRLQVGVADGGLQRANALHPGTERRCIELAGGEGLVEFAFGLHQLAAQGAVPAGCWYQPGSL